jgi:hypothetical protein
MFHVIKNPRRQNPQHYAKVGEIILFSKNKGLNRTKMANGIRQDLEDRRDETG